MMAMSDIPVELVTEILTRTPLTCIRAVRSTCKTWNTLSKNQVLGRKPFVGVVLIDRKLFSLSFDLQGIRNDSNLVGPVIKQVSVFDQVVICDVFHCDGLLLYEVIRDNCELVVWNPYLGETRWIQPRNRYEIGDTYALGYDHNHNHKILRVLDEYDYKKYDLFWLEIFEFSSNSWRVLTDVTRDWDIALFYPKSTSLKGNTYFVAREKIPHDAREKIPHDKETEEMVPFLLCFDFTEERFGPRLSLPFHSWDQDLVTLSRGREDQLAVLYQHYFEDKILEIWISTKIESNAISWSKFLEVDMKKFNVVSEFFEVANFFIDEEKKLVVVCDCNTDKRDPHAAYILGENDYFKSVKMREASSLREFDTNWDLIGFSLYAPSLVQLQTNPTLKGKEEDC